MFKIQIKKIVPNIIEFITKSHIIRGLSAMKSFFITVLALIVSLLSQQSFSCTIFHTTDKNSEVLAGRNFDWETDGGRVWFIPASEENNGMAIFAQLGIDMPYEGINDKGLFIGIAAVPNTTTPFSLFKPMRKSMEMVKVVLEQAQTVDEALKIFPKYTVIFGAFLGNPIVHFKMADKDGASAIVEYVENKMEIIKGAHSQIMTNHYISNPQIESDSKTSFERYDAVKNNLINANSVKDVQELLKAVSQKTTIWSNVYDLSNQQIYVTYKNLRKRIFDLKSELYKGKHSYNLEELDDNKLLRYLQPRMPVVFSHHFGYGSVAGKSIFHYGGRILLPANEIRKYGLEITAFHGKDNKFTSVGIILEQRLLGWFNMSIGTIGYFDYGNNSTNIAGLTTNLGWEPDNHIPFKPFVTYRNDVIFSNPIDVGHSLSVGFAFEF